jgi:hypothetical protein
VRLEARSPRRGEIVLAVAGKRLVLHRLLRRRGQAWLLRGDARRYADGWVCAGDILGVATARERTGGRAPGWRRLDCGSARAFGLVMPRILVWARGVRERLRGRRRVRRVQPLREDRGAVLGPAQARRGRGSRGDARDRRQSAERAPRAET